MKAKRYMKPPSCRKPATVTVPYAGPALDGQRPTRTISELRILSVNPGRKSWEGTKGTTSPWSRSGRGFLLAHRVAGGGRPPPAPTERGVRISRTTLFGSWFTAFTAICSSFVSMVS